MAKAKDNNIRIDVTEATANETRTVSITIQVSAQEFLLADLLKQRGAIGSIEGPLKQAVKETVQTYLDGAEELVAGLAVSQRKVSNGTKAKAKSSSERNQSEMVNGSAIGTNGMFNRAENEAEISTQMVTE